MDDNEYPTISESAQQNGAVNIDPNDFNETPEYRMAEDSPNGPPAEEQHQHTPETQEQVSTSVLHSLQSKGYDVSGYENDEQLIADTEARYAAAEQSMGQAEEYRNQIERNAAMQQQNNAHLENYQSSGDHEEAGKPEFDPSWANLVEQDETGSYKIRDEYIGTVDPSVAQNVNKYIEWRQERSNKLINDPVSTMLEEGLEDAINQRVNTAINSAMSQTKLQGDAQGFISQNAEVLYVSDPSTGQVQLDAAGAPVLSPVGNALNDAHVMLRNQGMNDPATRHQVAMQMVQNHFTQQHIGMSQQQAQMQQQQVPMQQQPMSYKDQYTDQPFAEPTNPMPQGYMPNTPVQPDANAIGAYGMPEHTSLGSLATALAVHKGYLQGK